MYTRMFCVRTACAALDAPFSLPEDTTLYAVHDAKEIGRATRAIVWHDSAEGAALVHARGEPLACLVWVLGWFAIAERLEKGLFWGADVWGITTTPPYIKAKSAFCI